jgi:hypothetical protein
MEDLDKKIIELMDLFDGEVTTADKIERPQRALDKEAIDDFMKRNPQADGGRIGFKKKGFVNKGGEAEYLRKLKLSYDEYGQAALDKGAKVLGFKDYASMGGKENENFRKKIKNEIKKYGEVLPRYEADVRGRKTRIPKEQGIQIKLLEATNKNKFFDPKAFAKENNISLKQVKEEAKKLQRNIYDKRMLVAGKEMRKTLEWIPNDPTVSDNALNKLWKSKLIKYEKDKIDELFYEAFGKNPKTYKKYLAIKKNLNEYRQLRDAIKERFPSINFELDHPLSKSSLNKLFNATTDQLTRVNVLEADLNNGFKDSLSLQYEKAVQDNNLNKKKAVEKIARDLKLNIGKISDDATNFKYGVKEFQKLNIKDEIAKSLENLSFLNKNFQTYAKNNPDLFKTAGVSTQQTFTRVDNVKGLVPFMKSLGIKCQLSDGINCMNPKAYEKSLNQISKAAQAGDSAAQSKLLNFRNAVKGAGGVIKGVLGPAAIAAEIGIAIPIGLFDYAQGKPTEEIVNTLTYGLAGKSREDKLKEEMPTYGQGDALQSAFDGYLSTLNKLGEIRDPESLRPGKKADDMLKTFYERQEPFMRVNPQVEEGRMFDLDMFRKNVAESRAAEEKLAEEDLKRKQERRTPFDLSDPFMAAKGGRAGFMAGTIPGGYNKQANRYLKEIESDMHKGYQYYKRSGGKKKFQDYVKESMRKYFAGGGISKLAGVDSGPPPERGPNPQGLQGLLKRVKKI